jgi:hypothetical protein
VHIYFGISTLQRKNGRAGNRTQVSAYLAAAVEPLDRIWVRNHHPTQNVSGLTDEEGTCAGGGVP